MLACTLYFGQGFQMDDSEAIDGRETAREASAALRAVTLERRVAALEKVVAIERRLRELQRAAQRTGAPPPALDDSTVLHRLAGAGAIDDSTVLHRPLQDDSTVLYRAAPDAACPPLAMRAPTGATDNALVLAAGFHLFEYRIDAVLGQGGFGVTYLATDVHLNARVAIKEYLPGEFAQRSSDKSVSPRWPEDSARYQDGLDNFLVEARTLATFRHPNIVRVARFFEAHRTAYMVLEYERGKSLKQWWPGRKEVAEAELLGLLQPLLDGLAVVHGAGFLHRDIKPDNIYVRKDDGSLVLLDFGAARQAVGQAGAMAEVVTPGYAPPEQYGNGAQGPWTDIYSLGATLYWMVSGAKPPAAPKRASGGAAMVSAQEAGQGRYSEVFLRAVDWALEPDPAARPQDLHAFSQKLFASHAGSLALQDALRAGETEPGFGNESLRALLDSPRLLKRRAQQFGRAVIHPASWPMVVKMTIAMVIAALLPMLITAYYNLNGSVTAVSTSELRNLERLAESTADRVSQQIIDSQNLANYMATDADFIAFLHQPDEARKQLVEAKLANLIKTNPGVHLMYLMNAQGLALVSSEPGVAGVNYKFREYFQEAVKGRSFKTGIIVGSTDGKRGMYYANPVFDEAGRVAGVIVLRIKASTIGDILDEVKADTGRVPFMIDGDGVLIHYPDAAQLHHSLDTLAATAQQRIAADQRFRKPRIDSLRMPMLARSLVGATRPGYISYFSTLSGVEEYAGYAPVKGHNWVVGVTESRSAFEAPLRALFSNVLYSVALVGLLFLVLAVLFARSIVRPIARLTEAANALKESDYDRANIKVTTNDEIGRLARTFNVMIDVLRQRERERRRGRTGHGDDQSDEEGGAA
jgi:serine/threonine protein kinase/HAMP domain-containing protein